MQATGTFDMTRPAPWYRHPWPWLLMLGPGVVVLAGFVTLWLAWRSDDGVVADDHYKRGLAINHTLTRVARGADLALAAHVDVAPDGRASIALSARGSLPPVVRLRLVHPTRAGLDRAADLVIGPDGRYAGSLGDLPAGRWLVSIETSEWRVGPVEVSGVPVRVDLAAAQP